MSRSKYKAKRTTGRDGFRYHSKAEAEYGWQLQLMEKHGQIKDLKRQIRYEVVPPMDGQRPAYYYLDFKYFDNRDQHYHFIDVKGHATAEYKLKKKLMRAVHGVEIEEVRVK